LAFFIRITRFIRKQEYKERNQIEGKFGQAKQGYGVNQIKAKRKDTPKTWISAVLFVVNIISFAKLMNITF